MIQKYLNEGGFVQIMRNGGSSYRTIVDLREPWLVVRDADSEEIVILSIEPALILAIITGAKAKSNYKKASEQPSPQDLADGLMGMVERRLSETSTQ